VTPVKIVSGDKDPNTRFEPHELDLLKAHSGYGCICLWCETPERAYPFVFHQRLLKGFLPGVQLVYCRDIQSFVRFASPLVHMRNRIDREVTSYPNHKGDTG
jgi:hypothetical protein